MTKLKVPEFFHTTFDRHEARYLTHCKNVAFLLSYSDSITQASARIREYMQITGAEEEKDDE